MQNRYYQITALYFLLLVAVLIVFGYTPTNDGEGYLEYARICLSEHEPYPCLRLIEGQPFVWNNGIINLIALSLSVFGSIIPLLVLFCLLKALTAFFIAKTTELIFNEKAALWTLILYVAYPNNWGQSTMLMSEIPMIFLAILAFYLVLHTEDHKYFPLIRNFSLSVFFGGMLFALANWFRPVAVVFVATLILYYVFFNYRRALRQIFTMLLGYFLMTTAIGTSCYLRTGYFLYQSDTLWFNMVASTYETSTEPHYKSEMFPKGTARYIENMEEKSAVECSNIWRERSLEWLADHPGEYLSKIPSRLFYMYKNDIDNLAAFVPAKSKADNNYITLPLSSLRTEFLHLSPVQYFALFTTLFYIILLILALVGGIITLVRGQRKQAFLTLFIIIAGSIATVLAVHGETRFKQPYMPFIFMLAGYAQLYFHIFRFFTRKKKSRRVRRIG
ncbi:MAG: glycosyltransferase family 39 protein [Prevotella sp.]|nr:glycosyltransferase family 39 protein [Prevotella sp.]